MKKRLQIVLSVLVLAVIALVTKNVLIEKEINTVQELQKKHAEFLANSPFKETKMMPRADRKKLGLPPNAFNEQMWELSMDPSTGRPMPDRVLAIQEQLRQDRLASRGVSGESATPWIDRGPNNQGGRTRGIMFDPNDVGNANPADDNNRVFAGGVSGGLWVNENITDSNESWAQLNIQANISVTAIISDPNNSQTFFIASGESFTSGQAVGRGIWRSEDGGVSWDNIFGGLTGTSGSNVNGIFYVNDIVARNVGGTTELYAAIVSASYASANSPNNTNGADTIGLYKSTDNGDTWARFNIQHTNGNYKSPCDIEIDINNNIWFTTTSGGGNAGGDIYQSTDGLTFTLINTISSASRTEFEPSQNNANVFWVAAQVGNGANLYFTNDGFASYTATPSEPADVDNGIPDTDFTRGQAFYDLVIEADANDVLYVGGIDLFRTVDFGINWTQISKWSNNNNLGALQVPLVHADQHAIVFRPGNDNEVVFGNDGGVAYGNDISSIVTSNNTNAIQDRNRDYNTTHFYYGDINQVDIADGDDLVGGLQDNGTQISIDSGPGANGYVDPRTGDGAYTEISKNGDYLITSYPGRTHIYSSFPNYNSDQYTIVNGNGGDFINQAELDDNRNVLYVNSSVGSTGRITRYINVNFEVAVSSTDLTNTLLNADPSAFKLNPHATGGVLPTNTATLLVGLKNGRLLKLLNADGNVPNWSNIGDASFVGSVSDIEFGQNENEIFVTMHNYGVNNVWYTTDGGTTWANKDGNLPDLPVKAILQNPLLPTEIIIGTELGMWATGDITATDPVWTQIYNGMSDVTVVDLDLRASDNIVLATTHGRGLFTGQFTSTPLSVTDNVFVDNQIKVFPTISNGEIYVNASKNIGEVDFNIFNINGQKVYNTTLDLNTSGKQLRLNLASGMYLVKISKGTFAETKRIIIK